MQVHQQNIMMQQNPTTILCPTCGIQFQAKHTTICEACILAKTDITIGITKQAIINYCRFCHRYNKPPWLSCQRNSKQLLAILLKKIKGLYRAKIINANFIWTEQHSKRIKIKITIEKQINHSSKIQQTFITQFIQAYTQCDECKKQFTPHTWGAVVQVRQHVNHKKTFYYIQQLILKHGAYDKVLKVSTQQDGINFYFKTTTHAQRLIDFLSSILPITIKNSKQLISQDDNSNLFNYKYTFAVQIPKICRNDLVLLPKKLCKQLGGCSCLLLCYKVSQMINLIDLSNYHYIMMNSIQYQHYQKDMIFFSLSQYKKQFQILDTQPCIKKKFYQQKSILNKLSHKLFMYTITKINQWQNIVVKAALGQINSGQIVQGFDLRQLNHNQQLIDIKGVQDVILVRRYHDRHHKKRAFKLKKLQDQGIMIDEQKKKKTTKGKKKLQDKQVQDQDYQDFLDDVQQNAQLRKQLTLYKNTKILKKQMTTQQLDDLLGQIKLCQLFDDMNLNDQKSSANLIQSPLNKQLDGIDQLIEKIKNVTIEKL